MTDFERRTKQNMQIIKKTPLEQKIIYQGPDQKAGEIVDLVDNLIKENMLLCEPRNVPATRPEDRTNPDVQKALYDKAKWWVSVFDRTSPNIPYLIQISPLSKAEVSYMEAPDQATNVRIDFCGNHINFRYKRYRFEVESRIKPLGLYRTYKPKNKNIK